MYQRKIYNIFLLLITVYIKILNILNSNQLKVMYTKTKQHNSFKYLNLNSQKLRTQQYPTTYNFAKKIQNKVYTQEIPINTNNLNIYTDYFQNYTYRNCITPKSQTINIIKNQQFNNKGTNGVIYPINNLSKIAEPPTFFKNFAHKTLNLASFQQQFNHQNKLKQRQILAKKNCNHQRNKSQVFQKNKSLKNLYYPQRKNLNQNIPKNIGYFNINNKLFNNVKTEKNEKQNQHRIQKNYSCKKVNQIVKNNLEQSKKELIKNTSQSFLDKNLRTTSYTNLKSTLEKNYSRLSVYQGKKIDNNVILKPTSPLKKFNNNFSIQRFQKSPSKQKKYIQNNRTKVPLCFNSTMYKKRKVLSNSQNKTVCLDHFTIGKCLGRGKYGKVYLSIHKQTGSIFALKEMSIQKIKQNQNNINQFIIEIKILTYANHRNILKYYGLFKNQINIYLILQFMDNGSLYSQVRKSFNFSGKQCAIYIRQIAEGIQYLHKNGISHRDIKPENVVLSFGVCKICDFGWATTNKQRRQTSCGTIDYIAPQIIQGHGYDCSVDLWCLGICTYELLSGKTPFYHSSIKQTINRIVNQPDIQYDNIQNNATNFIKGLLKKNPDQRFKIQDALKHPFISQISYNSY